MNPSNLPSEYQRYAEPVIEPAADAVELYGEREPSVWVPSNERPGEMVAIPKSYYVQSYEATEPRDLRPQPLFDPIAQRMVGAGVGSGVALWGGGQFLAGAGQLVSSLSGMGALLFFLAIAGGRALLTGGRGATHIRNEQHTHVHQKWLGRAHINNQQ